VRFLTWAKTGATCQGSHACSLGRASLAWARWCLTQNKSFRLSESSSTALTCSCKSRLGETGSLGRECQTSPLFLPATNIFSCPAKIPTISYIHSSIQLQSITKQYKILDLTPNKHEGSSCPYLEKATQTTSTLKRMSTKVPEADLRAENPNTKGVRDYYKELRRTKLAKKSTSWTTTYVSRNEVELNLNLIELQTLAELCERKRRVDKLLFCKNGRNERG